MKSFFLFLGVLVLAGLGFGFYANGISCKPGSTSVTVLDCYRLYLAFGVLFAVAMLLALSAAFYVLIPAPAAPASHPGQQVFDTMAKSLLPVVTLVLGYYFGSSQAPSAQEKAAEQTAPAASSAQAAASVSASQPLSRSK